MQPYTNCVRDGAYAAEIALAGCPNVGKSTIFNALTGLKQHTGNWIGKTVENAYGYHRRGREEYRIVDLPGTYSLYRGSAEEQVAYEYIKNTHSCVIIVVSATSLQYHLNLAIQILAYTGRAILCVNMLDEARRAGIQIDQDELSLQLGIPVVMCSGKDPSSLSALKEAMYALSAGQIRTYRPASLEGEYIRQHIGSAECIQKVHEICENICRYSVVQPDTRQADRHSRLDRILTSKLTGLPIMLLLYAALFWITAVGANYPSAWLGSLFAYGKSLLGALFDYLHLNSTVQSLVIDGVYQTLSWVISVMLPPMAIFFPLFSLLEDSGYLPRVAFNLDRAFSKAHAHPNQSMTMAMGMGCNACGVMGCRIIDDPAQRKIAIITNNFIPCNGRLPSLIAIISLFFAVTSSAVLNSCITALMMVGIFCMSVAVTLITSKILSSTLLHDRRSCLVMELPPYRKPDIVRTIIRSFTDKTLAILLRAIYVAAPAGVVIWCLTHIEIGGVRVLDHCVMFLQPFGLLLGLDGVIILAFILGFPANETVIPVMLMAYLSSAVMMDYTSYAELGSILAANGWTLCTALCFLLLSIFHYPCSTTCLTVYKETHSLGLTALSFLLPTGIGVMLCMITHLAFSLVRIVS